MGRFLTRLWRIFGFIGAVLSLRRWWRTLTDREEKKETRIAAGAILLFMAAMIVWSIWMFERPPLPEYRVARSDQPTPTEIVADFRDDLSLRAIDRWDDQLGVTFVPNSPMSVDERLMIAEVGHLSLEQRERLLAELRADPRVEAADDNLYYSLPEAVQPAGAVAPAPSRQAPRADAFEPNDPLYATHQWHLRLIGMPDAWTKATGKGVVVAVIDTGCAFEAEGDVPAAEDLQGTKFTKPYDFVHNKAKAYDDHGHGTHVAGTIAQTTNNGIGCAGIAYDATIMPIKVLSARGSGSVGDIADGIRYAANNGADVINMSLGGSMSSQVMAKAVREASQRGVTIVCAAGNSGREGVGYPAAYPECIAVAAVGPDGESSFYTSYGKEVAIAAPGGNFQSPSERDAKAVWQNTVFQKQSVYEGWQGTSMASPHVAGVAALLCEQGFKGKPSALRKKLQDSATKRSGQDKKRYGAGVLNAAKAVGGSSADLRVAELTEPTINRLPRRGLTALLFPWLLVAGLVSQLLVVLSLLGGMGRRGAGLALAARITAAGAVPLVALLWLGATFGGLITGVAGAAAWPIAAAVLLWGVKGTRPLLAGLSLGYAVAAVLLALTGAGPALWLLVNGLAAGVLGLFLTCAAR